jgi:predicted transcriptional regulator
VSTTPRSIRIPDSAWARLEAIAETEDRSVSYVVNRILDAALEPQIETTDSREQSAPENTEREHA